MSITSSPRYFTPDEYLPLHLDQLEYLRRELAGVAAGIDLVAANVKDNHAHGATEILELLAARLDAIRDKEMTPEFLVAPITRKRIVICARETLAAGKENANAWVEDFYAVSVDISECGMVAALFAEKALALCSTLGDKNLENLYAGLCMLHRRLEQLEEHCDPAMVKHRHACETNG